MQINKSNYIVHVYVCMYVCTYVCLYICMYVHMYVPDGDISTLTLILIMIFLVSCKHRFGTVFMFTHNLAKDTVLIQVSFCDSVVYIYIYIYIHIHAHTNLGSCNY